MLLTGYILQGDWQISNMGHTARAVKVGKNYFIKKYNNYIKPRRGYSVSSALYASESERFIKFRKYRERVNGCLASIARRGGNVVAPYEYFVDETRLVETYPYFDNTVEETEFKKLVLTDWLSVMYRAAYALSLMHAEGLVHGDVKPNNILIVLDKFKEYSAYIIDFDKSYFTDDIRIEDIGGDQCYMSPEASACLLKGFCADALAALSAKSDVFSLGLVFYYYLSGGKFPAISRPLKKTTSEGFYCGEASARGFTLTIDLASKDSYLATLIANMLYRDPNKRISAAAVVEILKTKRTLPVLTGQGVEIAEGAVSVPGSNAPKEFVPEIATESDNILNTRELSASGYVKIERIGNGNEKYKLIRADGAYRYMSSQVMRLCGYLMPKPDYNGKELRP